MEPGGVAAMRRAVYGVLGKEGEHGQKYDPYDEIFGMFTGHRIQTLTALQSFPFKMKNLTKDLAESKQIYNQEIYKTKVPA